MDDKKVSEVIEIARRNLVNFRKTVLVTSSDEVLPAPFHFDWSHYLLEGKKNIAIEAFRESAKTQYVLRAFPHYSLMFPDTSRDYIVLIKQNTTLAQNKLKEIEQEYESNPALLANCKKIVEKSGQVFNVDIKMPGQKKMNIRIEAYGKGSAIRGLANLDRRPKIVICDDLQDSDDARSDTILDSDWKWFLSDVHFLGQNSRIFMIGNNLGERCILEQVERFKNEIGFDFVRLPVCDADGNPHWPSKYKKEEIQKEKEAFDRMGRIDVWLRERMCIAVGEETRVFNEDDYRYYHQSTDLTKAHDRNRYAALDPASSKNPESCLRAIVVNEVDIDNNWFIPEVRYGRWDSKELIDHMFEVVVMWGIREFGIEKGQYRDIIEPFIYEEMKKRNIFFDIIPLEHGKIGSKLERIKMLQPRFKAHQIYFAEGAKWLPELKTELAGVTKDGIKSLYIDCVDALAMLTQLSKRPYRTVGERQIGKKLPRVATTGEVLD
jgi:hypothetical protein